MFCMWIANQVVCRAFATVKEFEGVWKMDPRFKDSWYFVRTVEGEKMK